LVALAAVAVQVLPVRVTMVEVPQRQIALVAVAVPVVLVQAAAQVVRAVQAWLRIFLGNLLPMHRVARAEVDPFTATVSVLRIILAMVVVVPPSTNPATEQVALEARALSLFAIWAQVQALAALSQRARARLLATHCTASPAQGLRRFL
jgi:hypothetical protein